MGAWESLRLGGRVVTSKTRSIPAKTALKIEQQLGMSGSESLSESVSRAHQPDSDPDPDAEHFHARGCAKGPWITAPKITRDQAKSPAPIVAKGFSPSIPQAKSRNRTPCPSHAHGASAAQADGLKPFATNPTVAASSPHTHPEQRRFSCVAGCATSAGEAAPVAIHSLTFLWIQISESVAGP